MFWEDIRLPSILPLMERIIPWHVFLKLVYPMKERRKVVIGWNVKAFIMIAGLKCPSALNVREDMSMASGSPMNMTMIQIIWIMEWLS